MKDGIMLMIGADGKAAVYDDTYDITIHCESQEEQDRVRKILENRLRWTPCDEGLPKIYEHKLGNGQQKYSNNVMATYEYYGHHCMDIAYLWEDGAGNKYWTDDEGKSLNVLAWMPLPEPYGGEDDAD